MRRAPLSLSGTWRPIEDTLSPKCFFDKRTRGSLLRPRNSGNSLGRHFHGSRLCASPRGYQELPEGRDWRIWLLS